MKVDEFPQLRNQTYLDNAGALPVPKPILDMHLKEFSSNLYGNNHSHSPSSQLTDSKVSATRGRILKYLNTNSKDYSVIFTQNATNAIQIVGQTKWDSITIHKACHTSIIGLGIRAEDRGIPVKFVDEFDASTVRGLHLFAFTAQCNFSGHRYPLEWIRVCQSRGYKVFVDIASYAMTSAFDLTAYPADILCISFYKLFGFPTGLGALIIRNELNSKFNEPIAGGTVNSIAIDPSFAVVKKSFSRFELGTIPFQEIISLNFGFDYIESRFGGWSELRQFVMDLANDCWFRMKELCHVNGSPLCKFYPELFIEENQGPIIAFNLLTPENSYFGYAQVARLAGENNIHLRAGCFCNPGQCQRFLELTSHDIQNNFYKYGHVCGDNIDLIDGNPTGALRISFGFGNKRSDIDKWIEFLKEFYLNTVIEDDNLDTLDGSVHLEKIVIYPIKSCQGISLKSSKIRSSGLENDRRYKLMSFDRVLTQKKCPKLSTIQIISDYAECQLQAPGMPPICFLGPSMKVDEWFSEFLDKSVSLVEKTENQLFSNTSQFLLISTSSLEALRQNCTVPIDADSFRPNFVIRYSVPFAEEGWVGKHIMLENQCFYVKEACQRCEMINIDQKTGQKSKEPLLKLAKLRRNNGKICFGILLDHVPEKSALPYRLEVGVVKFKLN